MKKYWLFAGDIYYPNGGMDDFRKDYDTLEEVQEWIDTVFTTDEWTLCWYKVYDSEDRRTILRDSN